MRAQEERGELLRLQHRVVGSSSRTIRGSSVTKCYEQIEWSVTQDPCASLVSILEWLLCDGLFAMSSSYLEYS